MFALVGVLAAVIYSIVAPEVTTTNMPVAVEKRQPLQESKPAAVVATAEKPVEFTGRLELKTSSPSEVAAFINKAIEFDIPSAAVPAGPEEPHILICSRQNLRSFLADLGTIWGKLDSAVLFVNTDGPEQIIINAATPAQIIEIAKQNDSQTQIKTAKYFAAMNNVTELSLDKEVQVAIDNSALRLLTIPKPVLTSSEKTATKAANSSETEQKVFLTIVVTGSE
jgi:hypothetical protein